jgi:hypothetical protein
MTAGFDIVINNKLAIQRRDIHVYHYASRSAHIISYNSSITLPLHTIDGKDYLGISMTGAAGRLRNNCTIDLPAWLEAEIYLEGKLTVSHCDRRTLLKIPPGSSDWELRLTRPAGVTARAIHAVDRVTIGDEDEENMTAIYNNKEEVSYPCVI